MSEHQPPNTTAINTTTMQQSTKRYGTSIEDGTIYVEADVGRVEIGPVSDVIEHFGDTYVIEYDDWEKERYDISFADEGMEMDVRETIESMTHRKSFVEWLKREDTESGYYDGGLRMGLFIGFLGDALKNGPF